MSSNKPKRTKAEKLEASKVPYGLTGVSWGTVKETGYEAEDNSEHETYDWEKRISYVLGNTGIELHPEFGSGWYFVVDTSTGEHGHVLADAMPLKTAKKSAEYRAKQLKRI